MTGSQCDNVTTPKWMTASAIVQQITHRMFTLAVAEFKGRFPDGSAFDPPGLKLWRNLRRFGELYLQLRSVDFEAHERQALTEALEYAHTFYHANVSNSGPEMPVDHCVCPVAYDMRELAEVMAEEETLECVNS